MDRDEAAERPRRWLAAQPGRPRLRGVVRGVVLLSVPWGFGIAAAVAGSLALFALAVGVLAAYAGAAVVVWIALRRVSITRTLDRTEVLEDQPITLRFAVRGLRGLPVRLEILTTHDGWQPLDVSGGEIQCEIDRPGAHVFQASPMRLRDDLGVFSPWITAGTPEVVLVLPDPESPAAGGRPSGGARLTGDPEPDGLRDYVPGTPVNRVNWASAARGATLQERRFVASRDVLPLVVADASGAESDEAIDWLARAAAGHVLDLVGRGGCRVLLPGDLVPTTITHSAAGWPALHRRLAAIDPALAVTTREVGAETDALWLRASAAPEGGMFERGKLPPGVVAVGDWDGAGA